MPATLSSVKLSDSEKLQKKVSAAVKSFLNDEKKDADDMQAFTDEVNAINDVMQGNGRRYSGAADTSFAANRAAFCNIVTRGNIPKAG